MHLSLAALTFVSLAFVAHAEDVTLFDIPWPTTRTDSFVEGETRLGISPLSVDQAGATHYVYSVAASLVNPASTQVLGATTATWTFKADATREVHEHTSTWPGDIVYENRYECVHYEDGTSVCVSRQVAKGAGTTVTNIDTTRTGTRTPWATVTNVEAALPASDDNGGTNRASAHTSFVGVVIASLGLGVALVLA
ncbi:hypothetical protein BKA70DRAFT_1460403 [Coprinopsis sp. MPI-PUGE-AT-0042]|nr:hypothetical protein BKA70DRAFT_1460403 [Coprinopsis sp. MPI-PUGE-AT-0042]